MLVVYVERGEGTHREQNSIENTTSPKNLLGPSLPSAAGGGGVRGWKGRGVGESLRT